MNYLEFEVRIVRTTEKAALIEFHEFGEEFWIPFSQIEGGGRGLEEEDEGIILISRWTAQQKGLI